LWLKCAMDLDRVCCAVDGPLPITDAQSRAWTHSVRGVSDAVLVGGRTLRLDDPSLNVREPQPTTDQPVPVILTRDPASLPLQAKIWDLHRKVWILSAQNMRGLPAHAEAIPWDGVEEISVALGRVGLHRVLAETGPELWSQALLEWNWDRAYLLRACRRLGTGKAAAKVFASGGTLARFAWTGHDWLSEYRKEAPCSQA
jgi:riboflavin biosynthesis pyrimidine reductase